MEFFKCMSADLRILAKLIDNDEIDEEELKYQLQLLIDELEPENDEYKAWILFFSFREAVEGLFDTFIKRKRPLN